MQDKMLSQNEVVCDHCGQVVSEGETVSVDGETWCNECAERDAVTCDRCGDLVPSDEAQEVQGETWCSYCVENYAAECPHCGELFDASEGVEVRTRDRWWNYHMETWCPSCAENDATECQGCGEFCDNDIVGGYSVYDVGAVTMCEACSNEFYTCHECGALVNESDLETIDGTDYCPSCAENARVIEGYGHTYAENFYQSSDCDEEAADGLYFGIELETECDDEYSAQDMAGDLLDEIGREVISCKEDGSLSDGGCEIVTQPMTLKYQYENDVWGCISTICRRHGATSHDNGDCGLHVHASRRYFNQATGYRDTENIYAAIERMLQTHRSEWMRFSRRSASSMSRWAEINDSCAYGIKDGDTPSEKRGKVTKYKDTGRYQALNLSNYDTIEFRMFRGTLRLESILASIEAVSAMCHLAVYLYKLDRLDDIESWTWPELKTNLYLALKRDGLPCDEFWSYCKYRNL